VPKPASPPEGFRLWPLWFVSQAFIHTRRAGALLIVGLLLNAIIPVHLPWVA
jgi:1,4-dihydroxy-2-naphthoate octaprenyltransferase